MKYEVDATYVPQPGAGDKIATRRAVLRVDADTADAARRDVKRRFETPLVGVFVDRVTACPA